MRRGCVNWRVARVFLDHALFFVLLGIILGLATMNRVPRIAGALSS